MDQNFTEIQETHDEEYTHQPVMQRLRSVVSSVLTRRSTRARESTAHDSNSDEAAHKLYRMSRLSRASTGSMASVASAASIFSILGGTQKKMTPLDVLAVMQ